MPRRPSPSPSSGGDPVFRDVLGYLNFSRGKPDARFQSGLNVVYGRCRDGNARERLIRLLTGQLTSLEGTAAFEDVSQARAVIPLAFEACVAVYRRHHADLLFQLGNDELEQPLFLARVAEAVLAQGPPWDEADRIVGGAVAQLNDFIGYRPVAVLENDRTMQPYPHEAFRPVPLFIRGAGVGVGPAHDLIQRALELFEELPAEIQREAHFDLERLDELALDVRGYDHLHPANKRTNYIFGEWDPHLIGTDGFYHRFVIRRMILRALLGWIERDVATPKAERLFDAAAVLCGTILMASAISGAGPDTHGSGVSLATLLPIVARQRDLFYGHLLQRVTGARAKRLRREAERTQQPFGHVRQHLNIEMSGLGARQVYDRFLAQFFARLGFPEASREQAGRIPCPAARFESEIGWRLTSAEREIERGESAVAAHLLKEVGDLLHRGIACGAIVDPWSILGFQGQFPLFQSREDAVPDQRVEILMGFVEEYFHVASRALGEASAAGDVESAATLSQEFQSLADWWDRFATTVVSDLPPVHGGEAWESACSVANALTQWRTAGESAGDISFWRQHVDEFHSPQAYGRVVELLLRKGDRVAAMALLMQWLSQAEEVGLSSGGYSFNALLLQWAKDVVEQRTSDGDVRTTLRRLFDYLEANAGIFWSAPSLDEAIDANGHELTDADEDWDDDEDDEESSLFEAAYEGVVYRDSAEDGNVGETLDGDFLPRDTEIELIARDIDVRLDFLKMLAELRQLTAEVLANDTTSPLADSEDVVARWIDHNLRLQRDLLALLRDVSAFDIGKPTGSTDSNLEYDIQFQAKLYLQHRIVATATELRAAEWYLRSLRPAGASEGKRDSLSRRTAELFGCVFRGDRVSLRRRLPELLKALGRQPLLYVALENNGSARKLLNARCAQRVLWFLLERLPPLGLLYETWQVLQTAYRMERSSRPAGTATTEFDRLLQAGLTNSLKRLVCAAGRQPPPSNHGPSRRRRTAASRRKARRAGMRRRRRIRRAGMTPPPVSFLPMQAARRSTENTLSLVRFLVDRYQTLWLKHSGSIRLSPVEALLDDDRWTKTVAFIERYGDDLLHAPMLMLSNIRAILHQGVEEFLEFLEEEQDPLKPITLLDDLERGRVDREDACQTLRLVYECILDKLDRFIEYNTTTTQSDYGGQFACLLDILRIEADYERDAWELRPFHTAHEVLAERGSSRLAGEWERMLARQTRHKAGGYLRRLREAEEAYSVRLPSVRDHLEERFVKPMAVHGMRALIAPALAESRDPKHAATNFARLRTEIDRYLATTAGSAIEVPEWLALLEREVQRLEGAPVEGLRVAPSSEAAEPVVLRPRQLLREFAKWKRPRRQSP
ncbi:MAG: hypothetical protein ACE5KM_09500 [Planctomycetaceae bacterium]